MRYSITIKKICMSKKFVSLCFIVWCLIILSWSCTKNKGELTLKDQSKLNENNEFQQLALQSYDVLKSFYDLHITDPKSFANVNKVLSDSRIRKLPYNEQLKVISTLFNFGVTSKIDRYTRQLSEIWPNIKRGPGERDL